VRSGLRFWVSLGRAVWLALWPVQIVFFFAKSRAFGCFARAFRLGFVKKREKELEAFA
jgi:hypothetical protein